jgi:hypothetical protein
MKKFLAIFLSIVTVLSLFAACGGDTATETQPAATEKDYSEFAGIVGDTKTWYDKLMAIPVATPDMTEEQLRQICVDAFKANASFTWTPTKDISYTFTLQGNSSEILIPKGIAYAGMFYCNNVALGNVWKALQYYDHETGAMDIEAMDGSHLAVLSSACAKAVEWALARVSNSHNLVDMAAYSQYGGNTVPVGPYTYGPGKYPFSAGPGTKDIVDDNGADIMCQSYAAMKMADVVYSSSSFHVMMASADPVVVTLSDGRINATESYILVCEQDAVGSKTTNKDSVQENGKTLRQLGSVDNKYTFKDLMEKGYVPLTVKEFTGEEPVEVGEAWLGNPNRKLENGVDMDVSTLFGNSLCANYAVCTMEILVKNPAGETLLTHDTEVQTTPLSYTVPLAKSMVSEEAKALADGQNTIHMVVRLANGELLEAFNTVLKY